MLPRLSATTGRRASAVLLLVAATVILVSACGSGDVDSPGKETARKSPSATGTVSPTPAPSGSELPEPGNSEPASPGNYRPPGPASPDDPGDAPGALPWLPVGPASPGDPSGEFWYDLLKNRQCDSLARQGGLEIAPLWVAAADLCYAVTTGDEAFWASGAEAMTRVTAGDYSGCLDRAVHRVLQNLLEYHRRHPEVRTVALSEGSGTACPIELTGITEGGFGPTPDPQTSMCGGQEFRLAGRIREVAALHVDDVPVPVVRHAENAYYFTAPPHDVGVATVTVDDSSGRIPGSASLTYFFDSTCAVSPDAPSDSDPAPDPTRGTSPSPDDSPNPSP